MTLGVRVHVSLSFSTHVIFQHPSALASSTDSPLCNHSVAHILTLDFLVAIDGKRPIKSRAKVWQI